MFNALIFVTLIAANCLVSVFSGFNEVWNAKRRTVSTKDRARDALALASQRGSFTAAVTLLSAIPPGDRGSHPRARAETRSLACGSMPSGHSSVQPRFPGGCESRESRGQWRCDEPGPREGARGGSCYSRFLEAGVWGGPIVRRGVGGVPLCGHFHLRFAARRGSPRNPAAERGERAA